MDESSTTYRKFRVNQKSEVTYIALQNLEEDQDCLVEIRIKSVPSLHMENKKPRRDHQLSNQTMEVKSLPLPSIYICFYCLQPYHTEQDLFAHDPDNCRINNINDSVDLEENIDDQSPGPLAPLATSTPDPEGEYEASVKTTAVNTGRKRQLERRTTEVEFENEFIRPMLAQNKERAQFVTDRRNHPDNESTLSDGDGEMFGEFTGTVVTNYHCKIPSCKQSFDNPTDLASHAQKDHQVEIRRYYVLQPIPKCRVCNAGEATQDAFRNNPSEFLLHVFYCVQNKRKKDPQWKQTLVPKGKKWANTDKFWYVEVHNNLAVKKETVKKPQSASNVSVSMVNNNRPSFDPNPELVPRSHFYPRPLILSSDQDEYRSGLHHPHTQASKNPRTSSVKPKRKVKRFY